MAVRVHLNVIGDQHWANIDNAIAVDSECAVGQVNRPHQGFASGTLDSAVAVDGMRAGTTRILIEQDPSIRA